MLVPIVALGLPIMDTLLAMFRRAALGRSLFDADRDHIHHRLMSRLHLSHRDAVLVLYGMSLLFGATALGLASANNVQGSLLLVAIAGVVVTVMAKLGYFDFKAAQQATAIRRRNLHLRQKARQACQAVERGTSLPDVWTALRPFAADLNAAKFEFWYHGPRTPSGEREGLHFDLEREAGTALPVDLLMELKERDLPPIGSLRRLLAGRAPRGRPRRRAGAGDGCLDRDRNGHADQHPAASGAAGQGAAPAEVARVC